MLDRRRASGAGHAFDVERNGGDRGTGRSRHHRPGAQVTLRIFIDGLVRQEYRASLNRNDLWAVAEIVWATDDSAQVISPRPEAQTVQQLYWLPPDDEGFAFAPSPF